MKTRILPFLLVVACSSDDGRGGDGSGTAQATEAVVCGVVEDLAGDPVEGVYANVVGEGVEGAIVLTDAAGRYELIVPEGDDRSLAITGDGYVDHWRSLGSVVAGGRSVVDAVLAPRAEAQTLNTDDGGAVSGPKGAGIEVPPAAFQTDDGDAFSGEALVRVTPLDPGIAVELIAAPSPLDEALGDDGRVVLTPFAVVDVDIRDPETGDELELAEGTTATIRLPPPTGNDERPATIPLWRRTATMWFQEGEATWNEAAGVFEGEVSRFSTWSVAQATASTCVRGRAVGASGQPVAGAFVSAAGVDHPGSSHATAGADGHWCVAVKSSSAVEITVFGHDGVGVSKTVQTGAEPSPVPPVCGDASCADEGDWSVGGAAPPPQTTGGGGGAGCSAMASLDPCLQGLVAIFECWSPTGECTVTEGALVWANGSKLKEQSLLGPAGQLCGTIDASNETLLYSNGAGQSWELVPGETGSGVIRCPNGTETTVSPDVAAEVSECLSLGEAQDCSLDLGGGGCQTTADCDAGQACCDYGAAGKYCVIAQACPQP